MKATCPTNREHNRFITSAHVQEDWVVDENGNFIENLGCVGVTSEPDPDNTWQCTICGAHAILEKG